MTVLFSDVYPGADADPIGAPYVTVTGLNDCQRAGNSLQGSLSGDCSAYVSTVGNLADGSVETFLIVAAAGSSEGGPRMRTNEATDAGYLLLWNNIDEFHIYDWHAGAKTLLFSGTFAFNPAGAFIKLSCVGDLISCYANGALIGSVHDSTYTNGKAGVLLTRQADPTAVKVTSLTIADNITAAAAVLTDDLVLMPQVLM